MRRTIVVADRDERLQAAFMTVFSKEHYEIVYASNGKEVERIAGRMNPDVYVVNVNLPKRNGIEVQERLRKSGYLERASFYFLKDEADRTDVSGREADGVIEKPINFFRVYETITGEDEVVELTDLVEEKRAPEPRERPSEDLPDDPFLKRVKEDLPDPFSRPAKEPTRKEEAPDEPFLKVEKEPAGKKAAADEALPDIIGRRLRDALDDVAQAAAPARKEALVEAGEAVPSELEQQLKVVLNQAMEEAAEKMSARLAPVLTRYVEGYVREMLLEITEKVVREEIDKLLKESGD